MTIVNPAPVYLKPPLDPPAPVPGCRKCEAWDRQRSAALAAGNASGASDCNIEIRRHPHAEAGAP
ncbi:hypothetical protein ACFXKI_09435 [Streptomyces mirabilis]|uniref:hypothetical protein n=1 Tax=Streptomyces mirabilis TaxID=68239 RepID=UPI0036C7FE13